MNLFNHQGGYSDTITVWILSSIIAVIFIGGVFIWQEIKIQQVVNDFSTFKASVNLSQRSINSFEDCLASGQPVLESYPRQCISQSGQTFVEDIGEVLENNIMIRVDNPQLGQFITSPLLIKGQARGSWFFEGNFPVILTNARGEEIITAIASAKGEWLTEDLVDFEAEIIFDGVEIGNGFLVFEKDNPSGLPANDDAITIPIFFK